MRLLCLGGLELQGSKFRRPKPLLLLAYLVVSGPTSRREIADLFFPTAKSPRDSLSTMLRYLRYESHDLIREEGKRLSTIVGSDVADLFLYLEEGRWGRVVSAYEGAFLKGFDLSLGPELEEWVFSTRESIAARVRDAFLTLAEQHLDKGEVARAASLTQQSFQLEGAPEPGSQTLARMKRLLVATGTFSVDLLESREDFSMLEEATKEPTEPQPVLGYGDSETTTSVRSSSAARSLPTYGTSFVGRDIEMQELIALLDQSKVRQITILGPGGVGKSRLAAELGATEEINTRFADGVAFVALDGLEDASQVPGAIARAIGLHRDSTIDLESVAAHIGGREILIILDNFERVPEARSSVNHLLQRCPRLTILVTSQVALAIAHEHLFPLDGLEAPPVPVQPAAWRPSAASLLFLERARKAGADAPTNLAELLDVARICHVLGGLPLAIELAAAWSRVLSLKEIVQELERGMDLLTSKARDVDERHRSVAAVIQSSLTLVSAQDLLALRRLSVFKGSFSHRAALKVAGADLASVSRLVDCSLLGSASPGRLHLHPLLSRFLREDLERDEVEYRETTARHAAYVLETMRNAAARTSSRSHWPIVELDTDLDDILFAIRVAEQTGRFDDMLELTKALWLDMEYFGAKGADLYAIGLLEAAILRAESAGMPKHDLLAKLGDAWQNSMYDLERALTAYDRAATAALEAAAPGRRAVFLSLAGLVRARLDRPDADYFLDMALEEARGSGDALSLCTVLEHRGYVLASRGLYRASLDLFDESLSIVNKLAAFDTVPTGQLMRRRFYALLNAGEAALEMGMIDEAKQRRMMALQVAIDTGNQVWEAHAHLELAEMSHRLGQRPEAAIRFRRALELYRRCNMHAAAAELSKRLQSEGYGQVVVAVE